MKRIEPKVLELLACPACRSELSEGSGFLVCKGCGRRYPVKDGVPVMLPPESAPTKNHPPCS